MPQAAFVLAFVKRDEISKFLLEQQPIKAIARHFDRNEDTVARAIQLLKTHEADIGRGDVVAVARVVWKGRLGWERSKSFTDARAFIEGGELVPKRGMAKRKSRRRRSNEQGGGERTEPNEKPPVTTAPPSPRPNLEGDDVLGALTQMPLVTQASSAASKKTTGSAP